MYSIRIPIVLIFSIVYDSFVVEEDRMMNEMFGCTRRRLSRKKRGSVAVLEIHNVSTYHICGFRQPRNESIDFS